MSADIVHHQQAPVIPITGGTAVAPLPPANDVDGWISVVADVARLAQQIAMTDFVPEAMRGKPAAVTAAILAGREMGVGPMTSLQHIHVIKGKPGQSAHLMRGLVLAAGHEIDYLDTTDTRALIRGRRRGETEWTEVEFTAAQAKQARIDLGGYPGDKLVARATARLCRRKFADVISGLAYTVEELQDGDADVAEASDTAAALPAGTPAPAPAQQRTAQRRTGTRAKTSAPGKAAPAAGSATPAAAASSPAGPPLPGDEGFDEPPAEEAPPTDPNAKATSAQNRLMHALFREAEVEDRADRLELTGVILERQLDTSAGLTVRDAGVIIDTLSRLQESGHAGGLLGAVTDLLTAAEVARAERELAAEAEQGAADDDARSDA